MSTGMGLRGDRLHRYVNAFCPHCHHADVPLAQVRRLSGWLTERPDAAGVPRIWLERGCPDHGLVRTLYDENPEILRYLEQWTAPTKTHLPDVAGNFDPVPSAYLRGLPEGQTQHTCILLADLTDHCNLRCPTCFADSSPAISGVVPLADVLASLDTRLSRENGRIDVLMLSGGEPTLYPHLAELLTEVSARNVVRILINTNGVKIARDDALLDLLATHRERVEVYLQYDGPSAATSRHHRGADLTRLKEQAVDRLSDRGIFTTLTMTATLGVNDGEIGAVVKRALDTPYVGGVSIQPQFGSGRSGDIDPMDRLTHTGVLARLGPQTGDLVSWPDLTALPCSHPHCCSVGYLLLDDAGQWRSLTALIGHDKLLEFLELSPDLVANRIADAGIPAQLRGVVKESLLGLLSEQSSLSHPNVGQLWRDICENCDLGISTMLTLASSALPGGQARLRKLLAERVKRITVKPFMDISTMIEERLTQCCVHVATRGEDAADQCAPFCAVQAWPALSAQRLSRSAVPERSLPLIGTPEPGVLA
ncbi:putative radical SAM superfamily Fe-S cluster-containing enzyme [Allocatelliglobosispora scoriae]|uniref:Putative radical SAM superfamily Fe-S cluster-containing enzyme n=1 Tax=Allocatelliglobosispora scoriae TaxID=643052 RepID=A0A841BG29_9ACTN|nr:radical SAM protein [Allocatelliglobosispora scoriae]MBB5867244.1 putative radical SAM superfamily Fe-S cluster-containing enzyme [Allocatelliglobosispora scoriae]